MKADLGTTLGLFGALPGAFWSTFGPHCFWGAFSAPFLTFPGRQNVRFSLEGSSKTAFCQIQFGANFGSLFGGILEPLAHLWEPKRHPKPPKGRLGSSS